MSPRAEAIIEGDAALLAQSVEKAIASYQAAITAAPRDPSGQLRLSQAFLYSGKLAEARESLAAAERFAPAPSAAQTKATFLAAQLAELVGDIPSAVAAWKKYQTRNTSPYHPATAEARIAALQAAEKRKSDYAAVKKRIEANVARADNATGAAAAN